MKKYIRTATNVFEVINEKEKVYQVIGASRIRTHIYSKSKCQTNIIKSADRIEDVIDCIIGVNDGVHSELMCPPRECVAFWNEGIYGAIWTKRGLKYIAKLNEEGEFELI